MPLPFAALAAIAQAGAGIIGGAIQRGQSRRDIREQNLYNSPINQANRARQAGLPLASLGNNISNQQSALPQTNQEIGKAGNSLTNYITNSYQLQQLQLLKAETRVKETEADRNEAERDWLLSGKGEDRANTNLTNNLRIQQEMSAAHAEGAEISNRINRITEMFTGQQQQLNLKRTEEEIFNIIQQGGLIGAEITGKDLENKIKAVIASYQPEMSEQQFRHLIKQNQLIDESISGAQQDNALGIIRNRIAAATEQAEVNSKNIAAMLAGLSYDRVGAEFKNYQQYQEFVDATQDILRDPKKQGMFKTMDALVKFLYTSIASPSGQVSGQILQGLGGGNGTINTGTRVTHFHNYNE